LLISLCKRKEKEKLCNALDVERGERERMWVAYKKRGRRGCTYIGKGREPISPMRPNSKGKVAS